MIRSTGLVPDSDLEDTDKYGNVPLLAFVQDDESGATQDKFPEAPVLIAPTSREYHGTATESDDTPAYEEFEAEGISPGEAQRYVDYMRPLSAEEEEMVDDPMYQGMEFVDDAATLEQTLRHVKGGQNAMTNFAQDESYGDVNGAEESSDRDDTDRLPENFPPPSYQIMIAGSVPTSIKRAIMSGLDDKLVLEHAAWLEEQDRKAKLAVRPRAYYNDVSRLWAKDQIKRAGLPTRGPLEGSIGAFVGAAHGLIVKTRSKRKLDDSLGSDTAGWSPFHALKKVGTLATAPARYGYRYAKKGIEFGISEAQKAALAPIKAVIRRFRNKMVNKRAAYYAQQSGVDTPTPAMRRQALLWSKNFVRQSGGAHSNTIASLMGGKVPMGGKLDRAMVQAIGSDIARSLGHDIMGFGLGDIARLIVVGPVEIAQFLLNLIKSAFGIGGGGGKPPIEQPDPGSMSSPQDGGPDGGPQDGSQDSGPQDGQPDMGPPGGDQTQGDGTITLEEIAQLPRRARTKIGNALRQGRLRLV